MRQRGPDMLWTLSIRGAGKIKRIVYIVLLTAFILVMAAGCAEQYDVGYRVDGTTQEYFVDGQECIGYYVAVDLDTFDLSQGEKDFNKQIRYVYDQVIKDDGYYQHTVWFYEDEAQIGEMDFTIAMVDDGHEWRSGWLITPNEDFYSEHFDGFGRQRKG